MQTLDQNPQLAAVALISAAPNDQLMQFVCNAVAAYFQRLIKASPAKLMRHGLRPVVAPAAAEEALGRVQFVDYSDAWIHALIANDAEVARLALRAVRFYAERYATAHLALVSAEVGEAAMQVKEAAEIINVTLDVTTLQQ